MLGLLKFRHMTKSTIECQVEYYYRILLNILYTLGQVVAYC